MTREIPLTAKMDDFREVWHHKKNQQDRRLAEEKKTKYGIIMNANSEKCKRERH